ncbi:nitroreductase [Streptomyces bohaiensis]|uniref:nitroreductase n=1 Tax=Streptomyces bohaiensis TaxID=1431344 RepID=UPI003B7D2D74
MQAPTPTTPDDATVVALVRDATAAPSMHNAQPWLFRYRRGTGTLALYADLSRAMPLADPSTRGLHLGCGAALFNLRVAAAHQGLHPEITLLPGGELEPELLAVIHLAHGGPYTVSDRPARQPTGAAAARGSGRAAAGAGTALRGPPVAGAAGAVELPTARPPLGVPVGRLGAPAALHPAVHTRHTVRLPFADRPIPPVVRAELVAAATAEGAELSFLRGAHRQFVLDLTRDAEGYDHMDAAREAERQRWLRPAPDAPSGDPRHGADDGPRQRRPRDGVPATAFGPVPASGAAPVRDFAGRAASAGRRFADFERHPQLALLRTRGDHPLDWLLAGQGLERVLLEATRHGLRASFATQALEWPELRWLLRDPQSGPGHVHMVLRLGYGPPGTPTPRRPLREVLAVTD